MNLSATPPTEFEDTSHHTFIVSTQESHKAQKAEKLTFTEE
jgi:hypothetical protein